MRVPLPRDYMRWVKAQRTQREANDQLLDGVSMEIKFYQNLEQDIEEDRKAVTEEMQMAISRWNGNTFGNSEIIRGCSSSWDFEEASKHLQQGSQNNSRKIAHIVWQVNRVYSDDPQFSIPAC